MRMAGEIINLLLSATSASVYINCYRFNNCIRRLGYGGGYGAVQNTLENTEFFCNHPDVLSECQNENCNITFPMRGLSPEANSTAVLNALCEHRIEFFKTRKCLYATKKSLSPYDGKIHRFCLKEFPDWSNLTKASRCQNLASRLKCSPADKSLASCEADFVALMNTARIDVECLTVFKSLPPPKYDLHGLVSASGILRSSMFLKPCVPIMTFIGLSGI